MTHSLQMRKFVTPTCEAGWASRLSLSEIPWKKRWKQKPSFVTQRDQFAGLKVLHRTLYTTGHDKRCWRDEQLCRACPAEESVTHLAQCPILQEEFWRPIIQLAIELGMTPPQDTTAWIATGAISSTEITPKDIDAVWWLGWRCIYAEITRSHKEKVLLNTESALKRTIAMLIGRLRAHAAKWTRWVRTGQYKKNPRLLAQQYCQRTMIILEPLMDDYEINDPIIQIARRLKLM